MMKKEDYVRIWFELDQIYVSKVSIVSNLLILEHKSLITFQID